MTLHLLFMALFGILVGVGASFTGLGGGFLMVPVLLFMGYSAQKAVGTSFLAILVLSISALVAHMELTHGNIRPASVWASAALSGPRSAPA